LVLVVMVG